MTLGSDNAPAGFVQVDDMQVFSSSEKPEEIKEALSTDEKPDLSKAAAELGKKGGEAAAKARAAKAEEAQDEPEVTAEAKPDEEAPDESKPKPKKGNPRHDPTARVAQATREAAELRRRVQEYEAYIERLESLDRQLAKPQGAPKKEDFEEYDDWVQAVADYKAEEKAQALLQSKMQEWQTEQQARAYEARLDAAVSSCMGNISEYGKQCPDFVERLSPEVDDLVPSFAVPEGYQVGPENVIADEIIGSKLAPALMLHLSEHPDDFQRIAALRTPSQIQREMAKLEARLEAAPPRNSSKPESSKAPPPLKQVSGAPHIPEQPPGDDASYEEHQAYWNAVDRKRRSARA